LTTDKGRCMLGGVKVVIVMAESETLELLRWIRRAEEAIERARLELFYCRGASEDGVMVLKGWDERLFELQCEMKRCIEKEGSN
jgi:hypothetical protein